MEANAKADDFIAYVKQKQLEIPVAFALELYRPLVLLGDSLITVCSPLFKILLIPHGFLDLFRDRKTVEYLLEQLSSE